ncbi:hypothetical protein BUMB_00557c [Candidatus Paraburkholderia calva]|nr:hypothetical protein BUMB_00557c [Candidatus Paraburkholderia calva]
MPRRGSVPKRAIPLPTPCAKRWQPRFLGAPLKSQSLAQAHGIVAPAVIDLKALAAPFSGCAFASRGDFTAELKRRLEAECNEAAIGNLQSPIKVALDVLRNTHSVIRTLFDFGGLRQR